ncbi:MAG: hypothetical protein PHF57_10710, partial [Methanoregula sp.]|nr:hypothetical protein [Methanoregula sp.]
VAQNITVSQKTDTVVLRSPRYAVRLSGFGMNLAWKKPYLASFGRAISGWIGLGVRITEGMPVLGVGVEFTSDTVVDRIS